jgi:hypothetical protein
MSSLSRAVASSCVRYPLDTVAIVAIVAEDAAEGGEPKPVTRPWPHARDGAVRALDVGVVSSAAAEQRRDVFVRPNWEQLPDDSCGEFLRKRDDETQRWPRSPDRAVPTLSRESMQQAAQADVPRGRASRVCLHKQPINGRLVPMAH